MDSIPFMKNYPAHYKMYPSLMSVCVCVWYVAQSCLTLCNPVDSTLPGSSVHGILQERIVD